MFGSGAPERIRTSDPQIRSLVLYPAELRARSLPFFNGRMHRLGAGRNRDVLTSDGVREKQAAWPNSFRPHAEVAVGQPGLAHAAVTPAGVARCVPAQG